MPLRIVYGIAGGVLVFFAVLIVWGADQARIAGDKGSAEGVGVFGLLLILAGVWVVVRAIHPRRHRYDERQPEAPPST